MAEKSTRVAFQEDALKKLEAQLECSLCLDYFKVPKLLPCFHTFCKSPCLQGLVSRDGQSLTCPICRHVVQLSEKGVAGLQCDFHIEHLFEVKEAFDKAKDSREKQCESCERYKATGYCNDCEELVCDECIAFHSIKKKFRAHTLLSLDELKTHAAKLIPSKKPVPNCAKHPENPLKIYCETCSVLICYDCTIALHREHRYDLVADLFEKHKQELVTSLKPVQANLVKVQESLELFDHCVKKVLDKAKTLENNIRTEIDAICQILTERKTTLIKQVTEQTQRKVSDLKAQKEKAEVTQATLGSCLEYAEHSLESDTDNELLAIKPSVMDRIQQILADFHSDSLTPNIGPDTRLILSGKHELQQASRNFMHLTSEPEKSFGISLSHMVYSRPSFPSSTNAERLLCATPGCSFRGYRELYDLCPDCYEMNYNVKAPDQFPLM